MGIGDWGLGIGDWAQSPIPKSPIPNPQSPFYLYFYFKNHVFLNSYLYLLINYIIIIK